MVGKALQGMSMKESVYLNERVYPKFAAKMLIGIKNLIYSLKRYVDKTWIQLLKFAKCHQSQN